MPALAHSISKQDIGHLHIIAGFWGLELNSGDVVLAREQLAASLLDPDLVGEIVETLGPTLRAALDALIAKGGRVPWAEFTRAFGDVRAMGAGRRDRASPAEGLFYRGLLGRAFFDTSNGAQEFAYIPDDLLILISLRDKESQREDKGASPRLRDLSVKEPLGRPAASGEKSNEIPATDHILDDATTLLAALRLGIPPAPLNLPVDVIQELLRAAGLIRKNAPQPEPVRKFLEAPRGEALKSLVDAWLGSESFNEMRLMPGILCEGEWQNQPLIARKFLLNLLEAIPAGKWWSLNAFIHDVKQKYADFQRPAGDYDSWFIKRVLDGRYLRGFTYWDEVDGALIRFFITKVLYWLGLLDLSMSEDATEATAFRITEIESQTPSLEKAKLHVSSQGRITAPRLTPRAVRYQLSRFCEWDEGKMDEYRYHITPRSLARAKGQGLRVEHLLALLAKHSAGIPPSFVKALKRWEVNGTEARVETQVILRVGKPEVLEGLRKSKAAKYLGEILGPTTVVVKSGAIQKVVEALTELGLLTEDLTGDEK
jgi:hypothetical protein